MEPLSYTETTEDVSNTPTKNKKEEVVTLWNEDLIPTITNQIVQLNYLGYNVLRLNNVQVLDLDFFTDIIQYCDNNYIPVVQLDDILSNQLKLNVFGRFIYEFYAIDVHKLLSHIIETSPELRSLMHFVTIDAAKIREMLIGAIAFKLEMMDHVNKFVTKDEYEKSKYLYYLDIVDQDLTKFKENFLVAIAQKQVVL